MAPNGTQWVSEFWDPGHAPQTDDRVDHPRALCVRSLEQNALSLIRKVLAAWWQDPLGMSVQAVAVAGFFFSTQVEHGNHYWRLKTCPSCC